MFEMCGQSTTLSSFSAAAIKRKNCDCMQKNNQNWIMLECTLSSYAQSKRHDLQSFEAHLQCVIVLLASDFL